MGHPWASAIIGLGLIAAFAGTEAVAQSAVCNGLGAELAALERKQPAYDPYGDAITKQRTALARGQAEYQRQCTPGLFGKVSPNCPVIVQRIEQMQDNLQKLEKRAPRTTSADDQARQRILARMQQNRCDDRESGVVAIYGRPNPGSIVVGSDRPVQEAPRGPVQTPQGRVFQLPGANGPVTYREEANGRIVQVGPVGRIVANSDPQSTRRPDTGPVPLFGSVPPFSNDRGYGDQDPLPDETEPAVDPGGSYRTLCVRTCDGYYFPISYSATRSKFANDADVCRARCPGTETQLFVHRSSDDSEAAVSADQSAIPYTKLPNALRYRREVVPACSCGRADPTLLPVTESSEADRTKSGALKIDDVRAGLPVPDAKPHYGEDPETLANLEADFVPKPVEPKVTVEASKPEGPKSVRVVGPKFYLGQ